MKIFKNKQQKKRTGHSTKKIRKTGSANQGHESSILKHARTENNVTTVDEMVGPLRQKLKARNNHKVGRFF